MLRRQDAPAAVPTMTSDALTGQALADADRVAGLLAGQTPLGVAYSGGVDSSALLALAVRALGTENVVALLGISPSLGADERTAAHDVAEVIGARVVEIETHEGDNPDYVKNDTDRCYHCKAELFTRIEDDVLADLGLDAVAYGENADDAIRPDRPGARAATEHRVLRPLAAAGMTKDRVRDVARALGLPSADKPAAPCLASRIPHGMDVTPEKLRQVDAVESRLRALGFADCRVRHHGEVARIEVLEDDLPRTVEPAVRTAIREAALEAGFTFASVDLKGIQSGAFTLRLVSVTNSAQPAHGHAHG